MWRSVEHKFAESRPIFWAGGFLFDVNDKSVLLHLRDGKTTFNPHRWAFFGGMNEGPETFGECFVRELHEELGVSIARQHMFYLRDYPTTSVAKHRAVFFAVADMRTTSLSLSEGASFGWISLDALNKYDLTTATREDLGIFVATGPMDGLYGVGQPLSDSD